MKHPLLGLAALMLAVSLSACGPTLIPRVSAPFNDQQVHLVGDGIGVANAAVQGYGALPKCPQPTGTACHDAATLKVAANYAHAAVDSYVVLYNWHVANPQGSQLQFNKLLSSAQTALAVLQTFEDANGVHGK